jgi:hypothetical protein
MYNHIREFDLATLLGFSDELPDDWEKRIQWVYKEINRHAIIRGMNLQSDITAYRDSIFRERDDFLNSTI